MREFRAPLAVGPTGLLHVPSGRGLCAAQVPPPLPVSPIFGLAITGNPWLMVLSNGKGEGFCLAVTLRHLPDANLPQCLDGIFMEIECLFMVISVGRTIKHFSLISLQHQNLYCSLKLLQFKTMR